VTAEVYVPGPMEGFEWVTFEGPTYDLLADGAGQALAASWPTPRARLVSVDNGRPLSRAVMPWLGEHVIVLRDEAIETVGPVIAPYGELLGLRCHGAELVLFRSLTLVDALDEQRPEVVRFASGAIMSLERTVLRRNRVRGVGGFQLSEDPRGPMYLPGALVHRLMGSNLTNGTAFAPVPLS